MRSYPLLSDYHRYYGALALYGAHDLQTPAALNGPQFLAESVITDRLMPENGKLAVPGGPGLGIEVDEGKLKSLSRKTGPFHAAAGALLMSCPAHCALNCGSGSCP